MRASRAATIGATLVLLVGCGSSTSGVSNSSQPRSPTTHDSAESPGSAVTHRQPVVLQSSTPGAAAQATRTATSQCLDRSENRATHLPGKLARLAPPLAAAQRALLVAERTYHSLKAKLSAGPAGQVMLASAEVRVTELRAVNYALERHDPIALAISTRTLRSVSPRLGEQAKRQHLAGCR